MSDVPVVAIDGPTASGKGTIAQRVADALQFNYLDSGALYRLVALRALQEGLSPEDADRLSAVAAAIAPNFAGGRITLDGKDVTDAIRSEDVSQLRFADCGFKRRQAGLAQACNDRNAGHRVWWPTGATWAQLSFRRQIPRFT